MNSDLGSMKGDGSVYPCGHHRADDGDLKFHKSGIHFLQSEYITHPILLNDIGSIDDIFDTFNSFTDDHKYHWNRSAGFHVHVSFLPELPVELWSLEFVNYFKEKLKEELPVVYKKRGSNKFCKGGMGKVSEKDIAESRLPRYSFINYEAYKKFKTLEFRIFPSDHPKKMREYLKFTVSTIESFLENSEQFLKRNIKLNFSYKPKTLSLKEKVSKNDLTFSVREQITKEDRREVIIDQDGKVTTKNVPNYLNYYLTRSHQLKNLNIEDLEELNRIKDRFENDLL